MCLKIGDALYYDEQRWFFIVDRYKEVIKCDNAIVAPAELESILLKHPSVWEAAVVGIPHELHVQVAKVLFDDKNKIKLGDWLKNTMIS